MKQLEFPISAAAVHLHGREFHAQDFYDTARAPADQENSMSPKGASPPARDDADLGLKPSAGQPAAKLLRWTLTCIALALAVAVVLSWLVRPDLKQVKWVDSAAAISFSSHA